jgi:hypothetical protein
MLPIIVLVGHVAQLPGISPYAMRESLRLGPLTLPAEVHRFDILEADVDAAGTYDDPFDPTQVHLDAKVTRPDGSSINVPGYLDRSYRRSLVNGEERVEPDGPVHWKLRFAPDKEGKYQVRVVFADKTGEKVQNASFQCVASKNAGFIRQSPDDHRYFSFSDGGSYWPLGTNMAWAGPRGTYDYDDWLAKLGDHGGNYVRLWLSPSWTTLAQELRGKKEEGKGVGQIDLANAWRLDHVLAAARQHNIYAMLCLDSYNVLRQSDANPWWDKTPHNSDNGGPLRIWRDFWSSDTMDRLYRNRLRYLVARWGADTHVFAWEFWNEVDLTTEFDATTVRDWHQRMARYLDSIDVYRHLRTTSLSATVGLRAIDLIPELDFMQTHSYDAADPAVTVAAQQSRKSGWGKPHFFGEIGADGSGPRVEDDPEGMQIHDPIWASIATGASGAAMPWWWDSLIAAKDLFGIYDAPSRFLSGVDWTSERFRQTDVGLSMADPKAKLPPGDLVMENGPVSWTRGAGMRPQAAVISNGVLSGDVPAGILHGISNHPDLHNPLTLRVRVNNNTRFEVGVTSVSGYGGANLRVTLDGAPVLSRDFNDPDGLTKTEDLRNYAQVLPIPLTKGVHTLTIENTGADWVRVGYRLVGVVPRTSPPLNAWAVVGDSTTMAWVRVADRTWRAVAEQKRRVPGVDPSIMRLRGLRSGMWQVEVWDTYSGKPITTVHTRVGIDGRVRVVLPRIEKDVAVKLVRQGA